MAREDDRGGRSLFEAVIQHDPDDVALIEALSRDAWPNRAIFSSLNFYGRDIAENEKDETLRTDRLRILQLERALSQRLCARLRNGILIAEGFFQRPHVSMQPEQIPAFLWEGFSRLLFIRGTSVHSDTAVVHDVRVYTTDEWNRDGGYVVPSAVQTGFVGRPTFGPIVRDEFDRRVVAGDIEPTLAGQAIKIRKWVKSTYPNEKTPSAGTIENHIRRAYRKVEPTKFPTK